MSKISMLLFRRLALPSLALSALVSAACAHHSTYDPVYGDGRYGDPRYQDPRYQDPRYQDPRYRDGRGAHGTESLHSLTGELDQAARELAQSQAVSYGGRSDQQRTNEEVGRLLEKIGRFREQVDSRRDSRSDLRGEVEDLRGTSDRVGRRLRDAHASERTWYAWNRVNAVLVRMDGAVSGRSTYDGRYVAPYPR